MNIHRSEHCWLAAHGCHSRSQEGVAGADDEGEDGTGGGVCLEQHLNAALLDQASQDLQGGCGVAASGEMWGRGEWGDVGSRRVGGCGVAASGGMWGRGEWECPRLLRRYRSASSCPILRWDAENMHSEHTRVNALHTPGSASWS